MDPKLPIRSLDYTIIYARQMAAMRAFYESTLRFPLLRELSPRWVEYQVGSNILALAEGGGRFNDPAPPIGALSVQLAFRVAPQEVALCAQTLAERGVPLLSGPTDQEFGHRTLFFRDPDGNVLEIYAEIDLPLPRMASQASTHMPIDARSVSLREITAETVRSVVKLSVAESQKAFVAPNAVSLAQALFSPEAWYRAIYLGDEVVGFVMLEDESLRVAPAPNPQIGVWRFMIDARFQRRGIGAVALSKVIQHVRAKGLFKSLQLSYVPGPGSPEPFYLGLGFCHTGRVDGAEVVLEMKFAQHAT